MDAIDGQKWVMFVAMEQNSVTLICDFNRMKVKVESYLKRNTAIQNSKVPRLKNRT